MLQKLESAEFDFKEGSNFGGFYIDILSNNENYKIWNIDFSSSISILINWKYLSPKANMFIKDVINYHLCEKYWFTFKNVEALPDGSESFFTDLLDYTNHLGKQILSIKFNSGLTDEFNVWNSNL